MKYLVVLCDGMADYPVAELGGKTLWKRQIPRIWMHWQKKQLSVW